MVRILCVCVCVCVCVFSFLLRIILYILYINCTILGTAVVGALLAALYFTVLRVKAFGVLLRIILYINCMYVWYICIIILFGLFRLRCIV